MCLRREYGRVFLYSGRVVESVQPWPHCLGDVIHLNHWGIEHSCSISRWVGNKSSLEVSIVALSVTDGRSAVASGGYWSLGKQQ